MNVMTAAWENDCETERLAIGDNCSGVGGDTQIHGLAGLNLRLPGDRGRGVGGGEHVSDVRQAAGCASRYLSDSVYPERTRSSFCWAG